MYKKFLIVASKLDRAGINITTALSQYGDFSFHLVEGDILREENLSQEKISEFDFVIFASRHKSSSGKKTLSVHSPGNWRDADFGGKDGKVCPSSAQFQKQLFQNLQKYRDEQRLENYDVTLEATHHGPLIDKPCVFIEIGSTETEWRDRKAAFCIAKTISETIEKFKISPYNEIAIGLGGPHYCPEFNKMQLESNIAFSHIVPSYVMPLTEEILQEAWEKTDEEPDFFVVDWKGLGNSEVRKELIETLEKIHLPWRKMKDIKN